RRSRRRSGARRARSACGRLLRVGAARGVRGSRRARDARPAQRDVRAARARDHRGDDGRLSQQRPDVPQRVLAVAHAALRSRPLRGGPVEVGPLRSPRHRPRVLRHPLAHERLHPGVQPPLLQRDGRERALSDRRRAAGHLYPRRVARRIRARLAQRERRPRDARPRGRLHPPMTLLASLTNRIFIAAALLAIVTTGLAVYVVGLRASREAEVQLARGLAEAGALVEEQRETLANQSLLVARLLADLPKLKGAVETADPQTVAPIAADYRRQVGADLLVVSGRSGELLAAVPAGSARPARDAVRQ